MINSFFLFCRFGKNLKDFSHLGLVLKAASQGYEWTSAAVFTKEQILLALQIEDDGPEWVLRKAAVALAFCGGLRGYELRNLLWGDITEEEEGFWVVYTPAKQGGEVKKNKFLVPFNRDNKMHCIGSRLKRYMVAVEASLRGMEDDSPLFHRVLKAGYGSAPMGKNYLANTGKMVAERLGLKNPDRYTGHTFRRSSATASATEGATVMDLMRHHNWRNEGTAMRYLDATKDQGRRMACLLYTSDAADE